MKDWEGKTTLYLRKILIYIKINSESMKCPKCGNTEVQELRRYSNWLERVTCGIGVAGCMAATFIPIPHVFRGAAVVGAVTLGKNMPKKTITAVYRCTSCKCGYEWSEKI